MATLQTLQGPEILWGALGPPLGYEESDVKGIDTFSKFVAGAQACGIDLDSGEYTVFAPPDEVIDEFVSGGGKITDDVIKYHILPRRVPCSAFSTADLETVQGESLTYRRNFRKDFLDDATPGTKGPADVACSNGLIHCCNQVLTPGWGTSEFESYSAGGNDEEKKKAWLASKLDN